MTTTPLLAPSGILGTIQTSNGNTYNVPASGLVTVDSTEVASLMRAGFVPIRQIGGVGTPGSGVTPAEYVAGGRHTTVLTIATTLPAIAGGAALGIGNLIYTFPAGALVVENSYMSLAITQTQGHITADTPVVGIGTTIASGVISVLSGTAAFQNIMVGTAAADCNGTPTVKTALATASPFGLVIAASGGLNHTVYANAALSWAASGDVAALLAGTVVLHWSFEQ